MTFRKIILSLFVTLSMAAHAQARLPTERPASTPASIFELPPFERAICCIRFYEGLHRAKDYPYVGYGHKLRPGERYSSNMSANEAEQLLRKDLRELCAMFRSYGQDSLLLSEISDNKRLFLRKLCSNFPRTGFLTSFQNRFIIHRVLLMKRKALLQLR